MGTAGARFMVAKQLAASGGLYLEEGGTRLAMVCKIYARVRCVRSAPDRV